MTLPKTVVKLDIPRTEDRTIKLQFASVNYVLEAKINNE